MEGKFSLPENSWDILSKIILGYFAAGNKKEKFSQQDVANRAGLDKTTVSRNNKFLLSIGILEKNDGQYLLSSDGKALGLALEHDDKEVIQRSLYKCIAQSDFISQILDSVRIRGGMNYEALISHIMMLANLPKEARYKAGSAALIDIMLISGCIVKDDNFIKVVKELDVNPSITNIDLSDTKDGKIGSTDKSFVSISNVNGGNYLVNVKLDISITVQDLISNGEEIGKKLKDLLNYLKKDEGV